MLFFWTFLLSNWNANMSQAWLLRYLTEHMSWYQLKTFRHWKKVKPSLADHAQCYCRSGGMGCVKGRLPPNEVGWDDGSGRKGKASWHFASPFPGGSFGAVTWPYNRGTHGGSGEGFSKTESVDDPNLHKIRKEKKTFRIFLWKSHWLNSRH